MGSQANFSVAVPQILSIEGGSREGASVWGPKWVVQDRPCLYVTAMVTLIVRGLQLAYNWFFITSRYSDVTDFGCPVRSSDLGR